MTEGAQKAVQIMESLPSWVDKSFGTAEQTALTEAALELQQLDQADVRAAVVELTRESGAEGTLARSSKVYLVLRAYFAVPETVEYSSAKVFGSWRHPSIGKPDEAFLLSWPLRFRGGEISAVEDFRGYAGAPYDGAGEFDYFRDSWPVRNLGADQPPADPDAGDPAAGP